MKHLIGVITVLLLFAGVQAGSGVGVAAAEELVVYTAIEPEWLPRYKKSFEDAHPDITIKWVRETTGVITARLLAEKDAPKADAVLGVGATSLLLLRAEGLLLPYTPKEYDKLLPAMRDAAQPATWVGTTAWASAFCVNRKEMEKRGLPVPASWNDLTREEYRGLIAMPDPASSGTGFMDLTAWIQMFGEDAAWQYAEKLHPNVKFYTHSGSKPCTMAAQGEAPIGISSEAFIGNLLKRRAPIEIVLPAEGLGWEVEAGGIIKTTPHLAAAKTLMDWSTSDAAGALGAEFSGLPARADHIPERSKATADRLCKNDLQWAADNRERLLGQWRERFAAR
ncbi:MAG: putative 2-aminoethylphosphonate ABC transporter substrate-binding protein [Desulfovibrio sp.]|nr:putative 2-aminoethylphosphonate ABC transporter substrate-binding protein [Desulfovibrio sp.]